MFTRHDWHRGGQSRFGADFNAAEPVMEQPLFRHLAVLGLGLMGASIALAAKRGRLAGHITGWSRSAATRREAESLAFCDSMAETPEAAVKGADLVIFCVPLGAYTELAEKITPALEENALVSDVGSVKAPVAGLLSKLPQSVCLIPAHPVAGTEESGPKAGFATLFDGRMVILTPLEGTPDAALASLQRFWQGCGASCRILDAETHDRVLALTSHLPHMLAYALVNAAMHSQFAGMEEVVAFSAGGFRDFTRVAASHPVMWRDIFLANAEKIAATLEELEQSIALLREAMLAGDGEKLAKIFTETRAMRQAVLEARQDAPLPDFGRHQGEGSAAVSSRMRVSSASIKGRRANPAGKGSKKRKIISPE